MRYRVGSIVADVRGLGTVRRGDEIELDPEFAESISGPGGVLLEPIQPEEIPGEEKEGT